MGAREGHDDEHAAVITPYKDGPLLVRGDFTLRTPDGEIIDPGRKTVALCRCGLSTRKPFCDGTHRSGRFRAGARPDAGR
jgi:CDGSH-type Zn-finger protein